MGRNQSCWSPAAQRRGPMELGPRLLRGVAWLVLVPQRREKTASWRWDPGLSEESRTGLAPGGPQITWAMDPAAKSEVYHWLVLAKGGNSPFPFVQPSRLPPVPLQAQPNRDSRLSRNVCRASNTEKGWALRNDGLITVHYFTLSDRDFIDLFYFHEQCL